MQLSDDVTMICSLLVAFLCSTTLPLHHRLTRLTFPNPSTLTKPTLSSTVLDSAHISQWHPQPAPKSVTPLLQQAPHLTDWPARQVASDAASKHASKPEALGAVPPGSLAAESLADPQGHFGEGNAHATPAAVGARDATVDASGATTLPPAPHAAARDAEHGASERAVLEAAQGQGKAAGAGPTYATSAGAGAAPARTPGDLRPKGKNLTEGGFEGEAAPTTDIGSDMDPARVAEGAAQLRDSKSALAAGQPRQTGGAAGQGVYHAVGEREA